MLTLLVLILGVSTLVKALGPLPDASQESLLWQFKSYSNVALFHFIVPAEVTRATWEFASFHDKDGCPSRKVEIFLQHGSFPVFPLENSTFPENFYLKRTHLDQLFVYSAYQPRNSANYPVYNPLPGSWFVAAYLEPFSESLGFRHKCKYSLGSIALWNKAESVELILPNTPTQNFRTKKHFSYFKFFVPEDVDHFKLVVSNCIVRLTQRPIGLTGDECIDYVALRGKALPLHEPTVWRDDDETQSVSNVTSNGEATFIEQRPFQSTYYYVLVVTQGQVTFDLSLEFYGCGMRGLYGPGQHDWFLDEKGLMHSDKLNKSQPKEPTTGFQLFATRPAEDHLDLVKNFDLDNNDENQMNNSGSVSSNSCISTFDLTRMDSVTPFSVAFVFQGKSWYTKWLTVLERVPVFASFNILDFVDLGGDLNIKLTLDNSDEDPYPESPEPSDLLQEVYVCLSKDRQPKLLEGQFMSCDNRDSVLQLTNNSKEGLKVIPYPEPGKWYVGFQVRCSQNKAYVPCPSQLRSAMVGVEIRLQPCGSRPMHDLCGEYGVCATTTKGAFRLSSCACFGGYKGWTCDDDSLVIKNFLLAKTLFLILSNFAFLPAIVLAIYFRLFSEAMVYSATMLFSIFYHACDQEASSHGLPVSLQEVCQLFYTTNEVLQFCDFYCAILSFWITIVALARLPYKIVNFLNLFGVLLVAFLVQYNRTGVEVLFVPLLLGVFVLIFSFSYKSYQRRRLYLPNRSCLSLLFPASFCSILAASLTAFVETTENYPYIHSVWHMLMAGALLFLVPRCREPTKKWKPDDPVPPKDAIEALDAASISENSSHSGSTSRGIPSTESSDTVSSVQSLKIETDDGSGLANPKPVELRSRTHQDGQVTHISSL